MIGESDVDAVQKLRQSGYSTITEADLLLLKEIEEIEMTNVHEVY
jgi:hypothetical protein